MDQFTKDTDIIEYIQSLETRIEALQREVDNLYQENIETSNSLYEIHNRIDMISNTPQVLPQYAVDSPRSVTFDESDFLV